MKLSSRMFWLLFVLVVTSLVFFLGFRNSKSQTNKALCITIGVLFWLLGDMIIKKGKRTPK